MARTFKVGDVVYVPSVLLPDGDSYPTSIHRTEIIEIDGKKVKVRAKYGKESDLIAKSKILKNVGIAIITIGDLETEDTLLAPLSKSILQFCRLLLDDDCIRQVSIRAIGELGVWWAKNHSAYSYIVFIGHGSDVGIKFGYGGIRGAEKFQARVFGDDTTDKKTFISLCCETGKAGFAKQFSALGVCGSFIGPLRSIHGAIAAQFFQTYMCYCLLQAKTGRVAFKKAAETVAGSDRFCLWLGGTKQ